MQDTKVLRPKTTGRFNSLMELLPLELSAIEHSRFTTTFKLTYLFSSTSRHDREPDLTIRLYHDARTCEVMSGLIPAGRSVSRRTRDLDDGYRLNRFLNKWVSYCLRQGHGFAATERQRTEPKREARLTALP